MDEIFLKPVNIVMPLSNKNDQATVPQSESIKKIITTKDLSNPQIMKIITK